MAGETHVHTVECPYCHRPWTGEFLLPLPDKAACSDCIREDSKLRENHPDIHLNPGILKK